MLSVISNSLFLQQSTDLLEEIRVNIITKWVLQLQDYDSEIVRIRDTVNYVLGGHHEPQRRPVLSVLGTHPAYQSVLCDTRVQTSACLN